MKTNFKKFVFCLLAVTVFFSGIFCCCLTDFAQADTEEILPPCHQAAHSEEPTQSADECQCDDEIAILEKKPIEFDNFQIAALPIDSSDIGYKLHLTYLIYDYHAPPDSYNEIPLYIKHSILRI